MQRVVGFTLGACQRCLVSDGGVIASVVGPPRRKALNNQGLRLKLHTYTYVGTVRKAPIQIHGISLKTITRNAYRDST